MIREVKEETGLDVEAGPVAKIDSILEQTGTREFHGIRIIFHASIAGGALTHELSGSTDRCDWHSLDRVLGESSSTWLCLALNC